MSKKGQKVIDDSTLDSLIHCFVDLASEGNAEDSAEELDALIHGKEYIRRIPPKLKITQFHIDPYSLKLLTRGAAEQRYVINDFLEITTGIVTRYYTPTYIPGDKYSEKLVKDAGFEKEDLAKGTVTASGSGIVHDNAKEIILARNKKVILTTHTHLLSKHMMGGASYSYKRFVGRSTNNWFTFALQELAEYSLFFLKQTTFENSFDQTTRYHLARSLPWIVIAMGITATLDALESAGVKIGDRQEIIEASMRECFPKNLENIIGGTAHFDNPENLAAHFMRTIYVCSGLRDTGDIVIGHKRLLFKTLTAAKNHRLPLKPDQIPQNFDSKQANGATALLHAAKQHDFDTLENLLTAGASIHATDNDGSGFFHYLMENKEVSIEETGSLITQYETLFMTKNKAGEIPLHIAIKQKNTDVGLFCLTTRQKYLSLFLEKNNQEISPLDLAIKNELHTLINAIIPFLSPGILKTTVPKLSGEIFKNLKLSNLYIVSKHSHRCSEQDIDFINDEITRKEVAVSRLHFLSRPAKIETDFLPSDEYYHYEF